MSAASNHSGDTLTVIRRDAIELPAVRIVVGGPGTPQESALGITPLVVGSSPECDLVVSDERVSRRHCELSFGERGIVLKDLGSKNGTYVREVPIVEAILPIGFPASLGGCRLEARLVGTPTNVPLSPMPKFGEVLGESISMRALFASLKLAAASEETILLFGESGTGKELLAKAIHEESPRCSGPFEVLDCSSVAPNLIEAELFGHLRGAFTGATAVREGLLEHANGGTIFIDEVGELPLELQPKLLRALESRQIRRLGSNEWRTFDARVVAATHRDLRARVSEGSFRADLYYRLAVVEVSIPPLRDRKADIPLLVERFLAAQVPPRSLDDLPPNAMDLLMDHSWPGNVRELRNTVARMLLFPMGATHLPPEQGPPRSHQALHRLPLREARAVVIESFERGYLTARLREHGGKIPRAAESMGVSRQLLHRMLTEYRIDPKNL